MELAGKRVVVVGLAQTGIAVAKFCAGRGAKVTGTDAKGIDDLTEAIEALDGVADRLELGGHETESFTQADLVVMSPGVPELDETRAARAAGVEVIAEIELASRFFHPKAALIAITGTNGKSTTTALTGALCEATGQPTFCGGNLGNMPLIDAVDHPANCADGYIVAEVAGFMLEMCTSFRPTVGACLNITEDHLERYGTMDAYAAMKTRIFKWQQPGDFSIANANDPRTVEGAQAADGQTVLFSSTKPVGRGAFLSPDKSQIHLRLPDGTAETYAASELPIIGTHNLENAMAAYLAARLVGVSPLAIADGSRAFVPQKHRMELVGEANDIAYYDDSKGTNVAAVAASMQGFPRQVILIAGGVDKGGSYAPMLRVLDEVARGLVLIGKATPVIRAAAEAHGVPYPIVDATDMADAVRKATELAAPGNAVVLSPACSSYDMFKNFEHRGMAFRDAVGALGVKRLDL